MNERREIDEVFFKQGPILKHNFLVAYLDEKKIYLIIISANLSEQEEERLLKTLKKHRATIGYTLDDLKGISPIYVNTK